MQRLYRASSLAEAHILRDLLEEDGLSGCLVNDTLSSLAGELPLGMMMPEVWVKDDRDLFMAKAVLREFLERQETAEGAERRCDACGELSPGNFELCWRCQRPF